MRRDLISFRMWETRSVTGYGWDVYFYKEDSETHKQYYGVPTFEWREIEHGSALHPNSFTYIGEHQAKELGNSIMLNPRAFGIKPSDEAIKLLGKIDAYEKQIAYLQGLVAQHWDRTRVMDPTT